MRGRPRYHHRLKEYERDARLTDCGFEGLAWAIIEQAVEDVKDFAARGIISAGRVTADNWPHSTRDGYTSYRRLYNFYRSPAQVEELLCWFTGHGLADYLEELDSDMQPAAICKALGI